MEDIIVVLLASIILVYLALIPIRRPPAAQAPLINFPVEESSNQFANYPSEIVVTGGRRPNVRVAPRYDGYNYFRDIIQSLLLISCYVTLYLLVCNGHIPEDAPVQEPIQCTNTGNAVSVIRGKDYPPPAD